MTTLLVSVGREIQFVSSDDLPAGFRRALAADNTFPNPLAGKRKAAPPTIQAFYHNPFTKEVALPRGYWPQFLTRAEEFGVQVCATEHWEDGPPAVVQRQVAVSLQELAFGMETLQELVAPAIPVDWDVIGVRVIVTRHRPLAKEAQEGAERVAQSEPLVAKPFPWEAEIGG